MTNQEINEHLAKHLFLDDFVIGECDGIKTVYNDWVEYIPDYCSNAMPVLQKFNELFFEVIFEFASCGMVEITAKYHCGTINVVGQTIHEAICLCAVEWLGKE